MTTNLIAQSPTCESREEKLTMPNWSRTIAEKIIKGLATTFRNISQQLISTASVLLCDTLGTCQPYTVG